MADVKVAINGFGRIGRLAFRQMFGAKGYDVVAINDLTKPSMLAQLLKYDTAQGGYCGKIGENLHTVTADDEKGTITVDGKTLTIYAEKDAKDLPWGKIGVDVVLECTGFYCSKDKSQAHIDAGAKKVVISAPAGNDLKTIVFSVNEKTLSADDKIISAASCTTNCLAPMAMKAAASESFGYNEDQIVSSDVIGMRFGSLFDATQTMVAKIADDLYEVQVVSWYDNENSYTSQMVRTIKYFSELG